jgi:hypothetical protein
MQYDIRKLKNGFTLLQIKGRPEWGFYRSNDGAFHSGDTKHIARNINEILCYQKAVAVSVPRLNKFS